MASKKTVAPGKPGRLKTALPLFLAFVWLALIIFAIIAAIEPPWLREMSRFGRTDESRALKDYGDNFLRQKDYRMAIAHYQKALEIKPDFVAALGNLAIAYNLSGHGDQGIKLLQDALKMGSNRQGTINMNIAEILVGQGRKEEAIEYFARAIGSEVPQEMVHRKIGILYFDTGQYENARRAFEKALEIQNDPVTPYVDMLRINRVLYANEPEHLAAIERLLQNDIDRGDLGAYDLATIEHVNQGDPDIAKIYNFLGAIDLAQGDTLRARGRFEQALKVWPDNAEAAKSLRALAQR